MGQQLPTRPVTRETVMGDEQIIDLYWSRDERAIRETDTKYGGFLLSVAHNILRDGRDCEECLNDTYLGAWNAMPPRETLGIAGLSGHHHAADGHRLLQGEIAAKADRLRADGLPLGGGGIPVRRRCRLRGDCP